MADRFDSPFDIQTPPGAEGWEELYTYSSLFSESRRDYEDGGFWFHDGVHWPEAMTPWDTTLLEFAIASLSQYNTRHYVIPPALGVDFRILNGYVYLSPVPAPTQSIWDCAGSFESSELASRYRAVLIGARSLHRWS